MFLLENIRLSFSLVFFVSARLRRCFGIAPLGEGDDGVEDLATRQFWRCGVVSWWEEEGNGDEEENEEEEKEEYEEEEEEEVEEEEGQGATASNRNRLTFVDSTSGDEGELTRDK